jgi:ABC-2 type transport system permease protein
MNAAMSNVFDATGPALRSARIASLAMPKSRVLRAYLIEAKCEFLHMLRAPMFVIPFLLFPPAIYLFVTVLVGRDMLVHPAIATTLFTGFSVFSITGPTLFGVSCPLAIERDAGLLKLKRAQPAPTGAFLIAKTSMAALFAAMSMGSILVAALCTHKLHLPAAQVIEISSLLIIGSVTFCAMGLCIGAHVRGSAAPGITHLIYLPMMYLSGLFFPLPPVMQKWAIVWPALHLNRLALGIAGVATPISVPPVVSVAYLVAITLVCGAIAIRRLQRVG